MLRGSDLGNLGVISFDDFIKVIRDLDFDRKIEFETALEVCNKYIV